MKLLLTLLASLSACTAASPDNQIDRIRNPTHQVTYSPPYSPSSASDASRLFIIGDVHGMFNELEKLLDKVNFSSNDGDRVIFAGDIINKGPDSAKAVQHAMDINATSVRGNHEDKVLRVWAEAEEARIRAEASGDDGDKAVKDFEDNLGGGKTEALKVARSLSPEQRAWLADLPIIVKLGELPGVGEAAVVHGGMVPGVSIEDQEDWAVYNIRALIDYKKASSDKKVFRKTAEERLTDERPTGLDPSKNEIAQEKESLLNRYRRVGYVPTSEFDDGKWWVEVWNEQESAKPASERLTLFYGHDSKRGMQTKNYSIGLDSRCVNGEELTALVLEPRQGMQELTLKHRLVSVSCPDES
ncbi:hypothetical protein Q7P37_005561 [Cladosporium fusiforme]